MIYEHTFTPTPGVHLTHVLAGPDLISSYTPYYTVIAFYSNYNREQWDIPLERFVFNLIRLITGSF